LGPKLQSSPVGFGLCWNTWASPLFLGTHMGPAFRTSHSDVVADAAWQAITSWVRSNKRQLQNSVHYLLPYRKKEQFKADGVKKDILRMEMVHH
jgi:hypothetical protein